MRAFFFAVLLACFLGGQAAAVELPPELREALDGEAAEIASASSLEEGIASLLQTARREVGGLIRAGLSGCVKVLLVVVLCGVGEGALLAAGPTAGPPYVTLAGALAIVSLAAGDLKGLMGLGVETITELEQFSKALLPALAAAAAAAGQAGSAAARQVATVFFGDLLLTLICRFLVPMTYCFVALQTADVLVDGRLEKLVAGLKSVIAWFLRTSLLLFTGYLTLAGTVAGAVDAAAVRVTRSAISSAVPVVGGVVANAAETVLAGAAVLRNSIGIFGVLAALALCLLPFLRLAVQYLLYKAVALAAGIVGPKPLARLLDGLGSAFGLILGMTGSAAVVLLVSAISFLLVVTT